MRRGGEGSEASEACFRGEEGRGFPRLNRGKTAKNARRGEGRRRGQKLGIQPSTKSVKFSEGGPRSVGMRGAPERHGEVPCDGVARGFSAHGSNWKSNLSSNAKYCLTHTINGLYQWEVNGALKVIAWPQSRGSKGRRWISEGVCGRAGRAENPRRVWRGAKSKWGTEGDIVNERVTGRGSGVVRRGGRILTRSRARWAPRSMRSEVMTN